MTTQSLGDTASEGVPRLLSDELLERLRPQLPNVAASLSPGLQKLDPHSDIEVILAALWRDGCVVIKNAVSDECADRCVAEMTPYVDAVGFGDGFLGRQTKRVGAVPIRSPASWKMVEHPILLKVCEAVLGHQLLNTDKAEFESGLVSNQASHPFQCHLTQIIRIGGGNRAQPIHRDAWANLFNFQKAGIEIEVSTIWALQDFTEDNGATRVVPGSHRRAHALGPPNMNPGGDPWEQAIMPKGSVVIYLGHTFHSGGENCTNADRWALNIDYNLGWLRQEVNHYLDMPPQYAKALPVNIAQLLGYSMAGPALGYYDGIRRPEESFNSNDEKPLNWATAHLPEFARAHQARL